MYTKWARFAESFLQVVLFTNLRFKGALSSQTQYLATESPLKMMKNAFYFILFQLVVLRVFKFLS